MRKPFFWKARGAWYATVHGSRVRLSDDQSEAYRVWETLRRRQPPSACETLAGMVVAYMEHAERQIARGELTLKTLNDYVWYLDDFCGIHGDKNPEDVRISDVSDWLASHATWGPSAQRNAIGAIKRVYSWAKGEQRIEHNQMEGIKKPAQTRRDFVVAEELHASLVQAAGEAPSASAADKQFRLVLVALKHSGGRPQDVSRASVEHVSDDRTRWVIPEHKTKRHTMKPRTVYLSPCLMTVTAMLAQGRTKGPLFRGRRGRLTVDAIRQRVSRLKEKLGVDSAMVSYCYRHTYITELLRQGASVADVAALTGTSIEMISRVYGHLSQDHGHLSSVASRLKRPDS